MAEKAGRKTSTQPKYSGDGRDDEHDSSLVAAQMKTFGMTLH